MLDAVIIYGCAWLQVLTRLGQVYERAAIEQHIAMHAKMHGQQAGRPSSSGSTSHPTPSPSQPMDPVTNSPLPDVSLTPVYPMRSRAMAYRESRARACAARACMPGTDAVRYLRRAAELAAGAAEELRIAGLSQEVRGQAHMCLAVAVDVVMQHTSSTLSGMPTSGAYSKPSCYLKFELNGWYAHAFSSACPPTPSPSFPPCQVCDYITSHASPAYDHLCLLQYADTLRAAGCTAQATTVYQVGLCGKVGLWYILS